MARFRVDNSRETGEIMLLIETQCGFRPVTGWPDTGSFREFAKMLIGICAQIDEKNDEVGEISDRLLEQTFNNLESN